jgi:hypothetical protein
MGSTPRVDVPNPWGARAAPRDVEGVDLGARLLDRHAGLSSPNAW